MDCDDCGAHDTVALVNKCHAFDYGIGVNAARIATDVPVWRCSSCGSAFLDQDGMFAMDNAVEQHKMVHGTKTHEG